MIERLIPSMSEECLCISKECSGMSYTSGEPEVNLLFLLIYCLCSDWRVGFT